MSVEKLYVFKFLLALDRFFGAIIFRKPNVTLSTMMGLELRRPHPRWWARLIGKNFLNRFWPNHCEGAIRYDAYIAWKTCNDLGFECPEPKEKSR
jgi:hypothetical protein